MRQDGQAENISKFNLPSPALCVHTLINGPKQVKGHVNTSDPFIDPTYSFIPFIIVNLITPGSGIFMAR